MIAMTSRQNTIHSTNQAAKKTRMRLPMAAGFTSDVANQIPTPVSAPTLVVMMKHAARVR